MGSKAASISESVREKIRLWLIDGEFSAGDRIPAEDCLGERFGVSRTTIREALGPLVAAGIIIKKRGAAGGLFVGIQSSEMISRLNRDHYGPKGYSLRKVIDYMRLFEPIIAETACYRRTDSNLKAIHQHIEDFRRAIEIGSLDLKRQSTFYHLVAQCCRNELVTQMNRSIQDAFWELVVDLEPDKAGILVELKFREDIYDCLLKGQGERARFLTTDHMVKYRVLVERRRYQTEAAPVKTEEGAPAPVPVAGA